MKKRIANCPACGAPVEFQLSTALVTVCDFCQTVVARTDKSVEDHGKVADLVDTGSPISRGQSGLFEKKRFEVVGRVQYQHPAGGVWDEWYLKFPGDRVRWLANAQGKFYLTSEKRLSSETSLPSFEDLNPGHRLQMPGNKTFVVAESGVATARSASGDIPWDFRPGAEHRFADLHGPGQEFGTIEFDGMASRLFLGREVALEELHLEGDHWASSLPDSPNTAALQINCPQCAGPLTLHAPDETLRVCCPHCKSLLDCQHGKLEYLQTLTMKRGEKPLIPLGAVGRLDDIEYTVIGFMQRFVMSEGKKYSWTEYLLHNPTIGFRWLVRSNGHWSFVEAVPVSSVEEFSDYAIYQGERFKLFDKGVAHVQYVAGEFYWKLTIGETVDTIDYIAPPRMLSFERTQTESGRELNISLGKYLTKEVVEEAFHVKEIPGAWGVGAIQPPPAIPRDIMLIWLAFGVVLVLLDTLFSTGSITRPVSQFHFVMALVAISIWPILTIFGTRAFEVQRWQQSDFSPYHMGDD